MAHGGPGGKSFNTVGIHYSNDSIHWTAPIPIRTLSTWSNYSQAPGLIGVPGGLLMSHGGIGDPTRPGLLGHGDSGGMDLFFSSDGVNFKLLKHIWPFTGGYSSLIELQTTPDGMATSYAVMFEAGGVTQACEQLAFMNFSAP